MKVKLIAHTPDAEKVIASAAKLCYSPVGVDEIEKNLTEEKIEKFINHLVEIGHESPLEHITFSFAVEGISRVCSHQNVRHRIASFSQQSQRYVKLDQFEYIIPPEIEKDEFARRIFIETMKRCQKDYDILVDRLIENKITEKYPNWIEECAEEYQKLTTDEELKMNQNLLNVFKLKNPKIYNKIEKEAIEDARYVFPNACETKMVITMNARTLLHFFNVRCCNRAQWEIREMATEMLKEVKKIAPTIFKNVGPRCLNGPCPEGNMSCGKAKEVREKFNQI